MKNLYKIQDELYIIDNNEKVTQNGIWAKCSFTGGILKNRNGQYAHKVILTTNNLLIKDGVQAIDDEFLEWFIKNPSCEVIKVNKLCYGALSGFADAGYKINLSSEEQDKNKYSEEEVKVLLRKFFVAILDESKITMGEWFEKHKKK